MKKQDSAPFNETLALNVGWSRVKRSDSSLVFFADVGFEPENLGGSDLNLFFLFSFFADS